jgi:hypothetical protein
MALRAKFTSAPDHTQRKEYGQSEWVTIQAGAELDDDDKSRHETGQAYKVRLESDSDVSFIDGLTTVTVDGIIGDVGYLDNSDNWNRLNAGHNGSNINANSVDAGPDNNSGVGVVVLDGSRGIYGPPQWPDVSARRPRRRNKR